jgi:pimeloyl-ACP methyl ester carboxylesterase
VIGKILKYFGISIVCLLLAAIATGLLCREWLQHKVQKGRVITSANGIDSLERIRIGGIDQWIDLRGQDVRNPVLLFIHGGPGMAFIPMAHSFQTPWEKDFTVVEWDQRGAGKTYASNSKNVLRKTMNVAQMEQDTLEVVNYLRDRFKQDKIVVVGHSWGSVLGLWLAHEHPELLYAYVGVGQVVNMRQNAETIYHDTLEQARANRNWQAVKDLDAIDPYPPANPDLNKLGTVNGWAGRLLGPPRNGPAFTDTGRIVTALISSPEYSLADDFAYLRGSMFSAEVLLPETMKIDLTQLGTDYRVPVFFFEGRHDPYCRPALVSDFSQKIAAPQKEVVWFEQSGHFPFFEEKQKFQDELEQKVLPLTGGLAPTEVAR